MKKFFNLLIATSIFICGLFFTGCNKEAIINNTANQWYSYPQTVNIPLGLTGDEESPVNTLENANIYFYFDEEDGLTVAIQAETEKSVAILGGLLNQSVEVTAGASYQFGIDKFGSTKWALLFSVSGFRQCDEPKVVSDPDNCIILGGENAKDTKVLWKKVLAEVILNKLLGE